VKDEMEEKDVLSGLKNIARKEDYLFKANTSKLKPEVSHVIERISEAKVRKYSGSADLRVNTNNFED
jgi:hypothetical protein